MHYYLYPKGVNAKVVAWGLENFFDGASFSFLDDSDLSTSFENNLNSIRFKIQNNEAEILICSKSYCDVILDKIYKAGILRCYKGIEFIANHINKYYKDKLVNHKVVGILLDGYESHQKHLGKIPSYLKFFGLEVIYLINPDSEWLSDMQNDILKGYEYVYATDDFLEFYDFYSLLVFQNERLSKFNPKVTSLKLFVTAEQISNQIVRYDPNYESMEVLGNSLCDYVNVHSQSLYDVMLERETQVKKTVGIMSAHYLKGGYPSIDKQIANFVYKDCKRDTLIFISSNGFYEECMDFVEEVVEMFIDRYRILWKSHPVYVKRLCYDKEISFIKKFMDKENFVYYKGARLNQEELERSICIFANSSSMGYSYPPLAKRPAILLYPKKSVEISKTIKDVYYNSKIHIKIIQNTTLRGGGEISA